MEGLFSMTEEKLLPIRLRGLEVELSYSSNGRYLGVLFPKCILQGFILRVGDRGSLGLSYIYHPTIPLLLNEDGTILFEDGE